MNEKRLIRVEHDRVFLGVAGGVARYLGLDPVIVRLLFVILALAGGHGLLVYILLAVLMPAESAPVAKYNSFDEEEIVINSAA